MKKRKLLGVVFSVALVLVLAACVYDDTNVFVGDNDGFVEPYLPIATILPSAAIDLPSGTFRGVATHEDFSNIGGGVWRRGDTVVDVIINNNQITDINVISHGETMYGAMYYFRAYPMVPDVILVEQSTLGVRIELEGERNAANLNAAALEAPVVFTGATNTQEVIVAAVENALISAGVDPLALTRQNQVENMTAPITGDRFIPGSHIVYVPADTYVFSNAGGFQLMADFPAFAGPFTENQPIRGGQVDGFSRVVFNSQIHNRNQALHGPTWHTTETAQGGAGSTNFWPDATANWLAGDLRFGTDANPNYVPGQDTSVGIMVVVNFARNHFQVMEHDGGDGLGMIGTNNLSHGESMAAHREGDGYGTGLAHLQGIGGGGRRALNGYWWIQTASRVITDNQSTHVVGLDTFAGATQSALGVRRAVEMAMELAGANPANITPLANPFYREPHATMPTAMQFVPGTQTITVDGAPFTLDVGLCRIVIRFIHITPNSGETPEGWVGADWNDFRDAIVLGFSELYADGGRVLSALDDIEPMPGFEDLSNAILDALRAHLIANCFFYGNLDQTGRLGQF